MSRRGFCHCKYIPAETIGLANLLHHYLSLMRRWYLPRFGGKILVFAKKFTVHFRLHNSFCFLVCQNGIICFKYMYNAVTANIEEIPVITIYFPDNFPAGRFWILFGWTIS
jgi:hypothetical protein